MYQKGKKCFKKQFLYFLKWWKIINIMISFIILLICLLTYDISNMNFVCFHMTPDYLHNSLGFDLYCQR